MSSDEVTLILAAIGGLKTDIGNCEQRLSARMSDFGVVQEEHGERITVIETRHRYNAPEPPPKRRVSVKRVAITGGIGGALAFIPQIIHDIGELIRALTGKQ